MYSIKKTFKISVFLLITLILSCDNEPYEGGFLGNQENNCLIAIQNTQEATLNFIGANIDNYVQVCIAYKTALQAQIQTCGDHDGNILALVNQLGDCSESTLDDCQLATTAAGAAEMVLEEASTDTYTPLCNAYKAALQNVIDACGDEDGSIQSAIDSLGTCSEDENPILLKKMLYTDYPEDNLEFVYNSENQLNEIVLISDGSKKRFIYIDGKIDKAEFLDAQGNVGDTYEQYIYSGNTIIERQDLYNGGNTIDERYLYSYNSSGLVSEINYIGANQTEISETKTFIYDSLGNVTSIEIDYVNTDIDDLLFEYTYDSNNNPFLNVLPHILLIEDFSSFVNNPLTMTETNLSSNSETTSIYNYSYNTDNFPLIKTETNGEIFTYEYY